MAPNLVTASVQETMIVRQTGQDADSSQKVYEVDLSKPLVFQVGHLLDRYDDWVHEPIVSKNGPRLFASDLLEPLTKTNWWVVPLVWLPVSFCAEWRALHLRMPLMWIPACMALGLLIWTALEYTLHRFLFHWRTTGYWTNTLHYLLHGCHHKHPQDRYRLVMPPVLFFLLSTPVVSFFLSFLPAFLVWAVYGGSILGYVMYDLTHYWVHFGRPPPAQMTAALQVRRHHMAHHFRNWNAGFGVTSPLWDIVFGSTFEAAEAAAQGKTQ